MYRKPDYSQLNIYDFVLPFGGHLDKNNRWNTGFLWKITIIQQALFILAYKTRTLSPFGGHLDKNNRWVILRDAIDWKIIDEIYQGNFKNHETGKILL